MNESLKNDGAVVRIIQELINWEINYSNKVTLVPFMCKLVFSIASLW